MNEELQKEQEQEQGGISFREIFNALFKWKWIVIAVVVVCTLLAFLLTSFAINPTRTSYTYSFYVVFPNSSSDTYPDGTPFDYRDIISSSNLVATKEGNEAFSDIDIVKMEKQGDISIVRVREMDWEGELPTEMEIPSEFKYTVTVKSSYFKSGEVAAAFITSLAQYPLDYAIRVTNELNYKVNLEGYKNESSTRYSELLKYLKNERDFLLARLNSLIDIYGENYSANGNPLIYWRSQVDFAFSSEIEKELQNELDLYLYTYKETEDSVLVKIESLMRENRVNISIRKELDEQREKLLSSSPNGETLTLELAAYNEEIVKLTKRIEEVKQDIIDYYESIHYTNVGQNDEDKWVKLTGTELAESEENLNRRKEKFEERLTEVYTALDQVADTCKSVNVAVYETESRLQVVTTGVATVNGLNTILISVIIFVLSLVIMWIVAYAIEKSRKNNNPPKEVKTTEGAQNQEND